MFGHLGSVSLSATTAGAALGCRSGSALVSRISERELYSTVYGLRYVDILYDLVLLFMHCSLVRLTGRGSSAIAHSRNLHASAKPPRPGTSACVRLPASATMTSTSSSRRASTCCGHRTTACAATA